MDLSQPFWNKKLRLTLITPKEKKSKEANARIIPHYTTS